MNYSSTTYSCISITHQFSALRCVTVLPSNPQYRYIFHADYSSKQFTGEYYMYLQSSMPTLMRTRSAGRERMLVGIDAWDIAHGSSQRELTLPKETVILRMRHLVARRHEGRTRGREGP